MHEHGTHKLRISFLNAGCSSFQHFWHTKVASFIDYLTTK